MAVEIEHKFLISNDSWRDNVSHSKKYIQGYMSTNEKCSVRVRIDGDQAFLNIKSKTLGTKRQEFEYPLPYDEAKLILETLCDKPLIEKIRYFVPYAGHTWEIDVFSGENEGLVVAEIELECEEENFTKPGWIGKEVSDDPRYYNICLVDNPYSSWS